MNLREPTMHYMFMCGLCIHEIYSIHKTSEWIEVNEMNEQT